MSLFSGFLDCVCEVEGLFLAIPKRVWNPSARFKASGTEYPQTVCVVDTKARVAGLNWYPSFPWMRSWEGLVAPVKKNPLLPWLERTFPDEGVESVLSDTIPNPENSTNRPRS